MKYKAHLFTPNPFSYRPTHLQSIRPRAKSTVYIVDERTSESIVNDFLVVKYIYTLNAPWIWISAHTQKWDVVDNWFNGRQP